MPNLKRYYNYTKSLPFIISSLNQRVLHWHSRCNKQNQKIGEGGRGKEKQKKLMLSSLWKWAGEKLSPCLFRNLRDGNKKTKHQQEASASSNGLFQLSFHCSRLFGLNSVSVWFNWYTALGRWKRKETVPTEINTPSWDFPPPIGLIY